MLAGIAPIFISYSERHKDQVAIPFRDFVDSLGLRGILVGEQPLPAGAVDWSPDDKVRHFLDRSVMFVALMTPDDRLEDGSIQARPNVIDEIRAARERPHLRGRIEVFKAPGVSVPSNINPTYDRLDPDDVSGCFPVFEAQAREFGVLADTSAPPNTNPQSSEAGAQTESDQDPTLTADEQAITALGEVGSSLAEGSSSSVDVGTVARAYLAVKALLAELSSADRLGVHEVNRFYRDRATLRLRGSERTELLRTMLAHAEDEVAPGWYWFRDTSGEDLAQILVARLAEESDETVSREGLKLLARSNWPLPPARLRPALENGLSSSDFLVSRAALDVLAQHGDSTLLGTSKRSLDRCGEQEAVEAARLVVRSRTAPEATLKTVLHQPSRGSPEVMANLVRAARSLPVAQLRLGLESSAVAVRRGALRALDAVSRLKKADVIPLIHDDPDDTLRFEALDTALRRRWSLEEKELEAVLEATTWRIDEKEALAVRFYGSRPPSETLAGLDWFDVRASNRYQALAESEPSPIKDRVRRDLDTGFKDILAESERQRAARLRTELKDEVLQGRPSSVIDEAVDRVMNGLRNRRDDSTERFILRRFQAAALAGLAKWGSAADAAYGREHVNSTDPNLVRQSVRLLSAHGTDDDVPRLVEASENAYGPNSIEAARAALEVSTDKDQALSVLLESKSADIVRIGLEALSTTKLSSDQFRALIELLTDEREQVRADVTEQFIARPKEISLEKFLAAYQSGRYFYNVVTRVDRALYAPAWLKPGFVAK